MITRFTNAGRQPVQMEIPRFAEEINALNTQHRPVGMMLRPKRVDLLA
jgi:hypothetical protein